MPALGPQSLCGLRLAPTKRILLAMRFALSLGGVLAALMLTACASGAQAPIEEPVASESAAQPASQEPEPVVADVAPAPAVVANADSTPEPAVVAETDVAVAPSPSMTPKNTSVSVQGPGNSAKPTKLMMLGAMGGGEVFDTFADLSPQLSVVVASASGGLDAQATQRVMDMARANFEMCANMATSHKSNGLNTVDLSFRISPKGSTSTIAAKGPEKFAAKCVKKLIRKLQFEESEKATKVIAKISFRRTLDPFADLGAGGIGLSNTAIGIGKGSIGLGVNSLGNTRPISHGSGTGSGYGRVTNKLAPKPQVRAGKPVTKGKLDKDVIRRVIRRKLPRIRYCYEKALLKQPTLAGTVRATFVISPSGTVTQAEVKGFDALVDACIATTLRSMQFPKPRGGGSVTVRYPFTFAPSK